MTTRALFVFEIDDDYLDDLNSYRRPRSWREKVGAFTACGTTTALPRPMAFPADLRRWIMWITCSRKRPANDRRRTPRYKAPSIR